MPVASLVSASKVAKECELGACKLAGAIVSKGNAIFGETIPAVYAEVANETDGMPLSLSAEKDAALSGAGEECAARSETGVSAIPQALQLSAGSRHQQALPSCVDMCCHAIEPPNLAWPHK